MTINKTMTILASAVFLSPIVGSVFLENQVSAEENETELTPFNSETSDQQLTPSLLENATPYITIENEEFILSEEASSTLTEEEIQLITSVITDTNATLEENDVVQNGENSFEMISNQNTPVNGEISIMNVPGGVNVDFTWWGAQVQFSSQAVRDLGSFAGAANTGAGITADELSQFLTLNGYPIPSVYLTSITALASLTTTGMQSVDQGNGVNLNMILYVPATFTAR